MSERKVICLIIDDEQAAVMRMKSLIGQIAPHWDIYGFITCRELIKFAGQNNPSVLFIDVEMPAMTGFELLEKLHSDRIYPIPVFVTGYEHYAIKAIKEKAFDYIMKPVDLEELKLTISKIQASLIHSVISEKIELLDQLTVSEKKVLNLLAIGMTSKQVAEHMNLSFHTINSHRNHILEKFGCHTLAELINKIESAH